MREKRRAARKHLGKQQQQSSDEEDAGEGEGEGDDDDEYWSKLKLPSVAEEKAYRAWLSMKGPQGALYRLAIKGKYPEEWDKVS